MEYTQSPKRNILDMIHLTYHHSSNKWCHSLLDATDTVPRWHNILSSAQNMPEMGRLATCNDTYTQLATHSSQQGFNGVTTKLMWWKTWNKIIHRRVSCSNIYRKDDL